MDVARDYEGLRIAADEEFQCMFAQELLDAQIEKSEGRMLNIERMEADANKRSLSPGYYKWLEYLFFLDHMLEFGLQVRPCDVLASEFEGVRILRQARADFDRKHPGCFKCGARNRVGSPRCRSCAQELRN